MFKLFKAAVYEHPKLGQLQRVRGMWRGTIEVAQAVPLALSGNRKEPDAEAIEAACALPLLMPQWQPIVARALFDHYASGLHAYRTGECDGRDEAFPSIGTAGGVWDHVSLLFVAITRLDGIMTTELGFGTQWDVEHTLGARFANKQFVELNGSVLPP